MRLPPDVEAEHHLMVSGRESGELVLRYNRGALVGVDVRRVRSRAPRVDDRPVADDTRPLATGARR